VRDAVSSAPSGPNSGRSTGRRFSADYGRPIVVDAARFSKKNGRRSPEAPYITVGSPHETFRTQCHHTGANQGLGLESPAFIFAKAPASPLCAAMSRSSTSPRRVAEQRAGRPKNCGLSCDVSDPAAVKKFVAAAIKALGSIQVLVNNAGIYGPRAQRERRFAEWKRAIEINLYGVMLPTQPSSLISKAGRGKIINLSGGGATQPLPISAPTLPRKPAWSGSPYNLRRGTAHCEIDVNAVAPGAPTRACSTKSLAAGADRRGESFYQRALKQRDTGGAPLELGASLCVYLASAESDGVTGNILSAQMGSVARFCLAQRETLAKPHLHASPDRSGGSRAEMVEFPGAGQALARAPKPRPQASRPTIACRDGNWLPHTRTATRIQPSSTSHTPSSRAGIFGRRPSREPISTALFRARGGPSRGDRAKLRLLGRPFTFANISRDEKREVSPKTRASRAPRQPGKDQAAGFDLEIVRFESPEMDARKIAESLSASAAVVENTTPPPVVSTRIPNRKYLGRNGATPKPLFVATLRQVISAMKIRTGHRNVAVIGPSKIRNSTTGVLQEAR